MSNKIITENRMKKFKIYCRSFLKYFVMNIQYKTNKHFWSTPLTSSVKSQFFIKYSEIKKKFSLIPEKRKKFKRALLNLFLLLNLQQKGFLFIFRHLWLLDWPWHLNVWGDIHSGQNSHKFIISKYQHFNSHMCLCAFVYRILFRNKNVNKPLGLINKKNYNSLRFLFHPMCAQNVCEWDNRCLHLLLINSYIIFFCIHCVANSMTDYSVED